MSMHRQRPDRPQRRQRGFTLIELMITVAVIAIIAAVAYPSYRNAVLKGRRAQGRAAIMEVLQQQERYMTQYNTYSLMNESPPVFKTFSGDSSAGSAYDMTASKCPNPAGGADLDIRECVRVIASLKNGTTDAAAGDLRMTSTGVKDCTAAQAPALSPVCWP